MPRILKAADLFCGAGGTSSGAEASGAARVLCAVNHWSVAVETHAANFPAAKHINSRLDEAHPSECGKIDLLFASPECTHHSRARGGRPTSDQQRAGAWDLMRWIEFHRPGWIVVENVREFRDWGPVGRNGRPLVSHRGRSFDAWLAAIAAAGYRVDHRLLNAADFGAATSRERLFVIARKGNRPPVWPDPTHGRRAGGELPGMGLQQWRAAAEIIDWSIPCPSVFVRAKPLADKTLARIEAGLRRFVGPFVAELRRNYTGRSIDVPAATITTSGAHHGLAVPFQFQGIGLGAGRTREAGEPVPTIVAARENHGLAVPYMVPFFGERNGQPPRSHDAGDPLPTVTNQGAGGVAVPFLSAFHCGPDSNQRNYNLDGQIPVIDTSNRYGLALPYLADVNHSGPDHRTASPGDPLATVTATRGKAVVVPFVVSYYGNGNGDALGVHRPLGTVTTKDRCGLVYAIVETAPAIEPRSDGERRLVDTMRELGVVDVGFRMLSNPELAAAQGFPRDYIFAGNKGDVTRQIGNAVCPPVAEAITRAIAG